MGDLKSPDGELLHAVLSPSSAKRWMACTPSARFEEQFENKSSVFAEEGTLAHAIGECILKQRLGQISHLAFVGYMMEHRKDALFTEEMLTHCEQYADYCMTLVEPDSIVYVETKVDLSSHIPESFGTNDFMVYTPSKKLLSIWDLKYGKGVAVDSKDNPQLKIYGIGGLEWLMWIFGREQIETVSVGIYQPRINNNSEWEISVTELMDWADTVLRPAAELAFAGAGEFVPGDHCEFCRGRKECVARAEYLLSLFKYELHAQNRLSDGQLLDIYTRGSSLVSWYADIKEHMTSEAVKGKSWPGMKLVEGKSNRVFVSEHETEQKLLKEGFTEIYTPQELLGVTKLKSAIGAKAFKEHVEPDLRKPPGKPTLVPVDDPRQEFDNALSVFRDYEVRQEVGDGE